eukprot:SM000009S23443  [mRNA]  locus=s9:32114:35258:+ [translate_table: standard]
MLAPPPASPAAPPKPPAPSGSTGAFSEGDRVLAYHGPMLYEAKVQEAELRKPKAGPARWWYFIHYQGWSKKWDEWLQPGRILVLNDANLAKQKKLAEQQRAEKKRGRKPKDADADGEKEDVKKVPGAKGRRRKLEGEGKREEGEPSVPIPIPLALKRQLVEDWKSITQDGQLPKLPRKPSVRDILKKYLEAVTRKDGSEDDALKEVVTGLRVYFDKSLPVILLYKEEREQYAEILTEGSETQPSEVYGAEHLLRLFDRVVTFSISTCTVKLPELLTYVNLEDAAMAHLQDRLSDFLKRQSPTQCSYKSIELLSSLLKLRLKEQRSDGADQENLFRTRMRVRRLPLQTSYSGTHLEKHAMA